MIFPSRVAALLVLAAGAAAQTTGTETTAAVTAGDEATAGETAEGEPEPVEPWLFPAFSVTAEVMLAAAEAVPAPPDADVLVLYRDVEIVVDSEHRVAYRRHWVYRVLRPAALDAWSVSEARWLPWNQEPPRIRARVLTPEGPIWVDPSVYRADPESDAPAGERVVRATLPEVDVGAVVEEEVVVLDRLPVFPAGLSRREMLVLPVPIHRGRLAIDAPAEVDLRHQLRLPAGEPPEVDAERRQAGGRVRWTSVYRDMPAAAPVAAGLPADRVRHPHVAWSTGEDWRTVAAAYSQLVDRRIAGADPRGLLPEIGGSGAASQTERIAEILAAVRARLRLREAPLGTAETAPAAPSSVLERGAADAKDVAALMVALLRAEAIPAYVALTRSGPGQDVEAELPGLGAFDHALVFLPAGEPIWIDPADPFSRVGELPAIRQGRRALVASPTTRGLLRTPSASAEENRTLTLVEVELSEVDGPAHIVETSEYYGEPERNQRRLATSLDEASRRRGYLDYVRSTYHARALGFVEETAAGDLSTPYRLRLEALDASRGFTSGHEAAAAIELQGLLTQLPAALLDGTPRVDDFVFPTPFVAEWSYRIVPPRGMTPSALPEGGVLHLADAGTLSRSVRIGRTAVIVDLRLDSGPARLSAAQVTAYRADLRELVAGEPVVLWFESAR
jgi:hypothetical protein